MISHLYVRGEKQCLMMKLKFRTKYIFCIWVFCFISLHLILLSHLNSIMRNYSLDILNTQEHANGLYQEQIHNIGDDLAMWYETFDIRKFNQSVPSHLRLFAPIMPLRMDNSQTATYRNLTILWNTFANLCDTNNITYFLYSGSMIGAYRHHGMVPWDDDIDVLINITQMDKVRTVLRSLPHVVLMDRETTSWHFFHNPDPSGKTQADIKLCWPFVEIFFFAENEKYIWDETTRWPTSYYAKHKVLPLQRRPFLGGLYPVPCNMKAIMKKVFSLTKCVSPEIHHIDRTFYKPVQVHCNILKNYFPFVHRYKSRNEQLIEQVVLNGTVISQLLVEPFC